MKCNPWANCSSWNHKMQLVDRWFWGLMDPLQSTSPTKWLAVKPNGSQEDPTTNWNNQTLQPPPSFAALFPEKLTRASKEGYFRKTSWFNTSTQLVSSKPDTMTGPMSAGSIDFTLPKRRRWAIGCPVMSTFSFQVLFVLVLWDTGNVSLRIFRWYKKLEQNRKCLHHIDCC